MNLTYRVIYNRMKRATNHSLGFGFVCKGCTLPLGNGERGRQLIINLYTGKLFLDVYSHDNELCYQMTKDVYVSTTTEPNQDRIS